MSIQVKMRAKNLEECVNYKKLNKVMMIGSSSEKNIDFLMRQIGEEVKELSPSKLKIIKKELVKAQTALISILAVATPSVAGAQTLEHSKMAQSIGLPEPTVIMEFGKMIMDYSLIAGVFTGFVWIIVSRMYYLSPKKNQHQKAMEIFSNTIKAISQIISIPVIMKILLLMASILFGGFQIFQLPL